MKQELPGASPALSLQNKLDQIAHERAVLYLLGKLARAGLREGDMVLRAEDGCRGRLFVARQDQPPRALVTLADGSTLAFDGRLWRRAG